MKKILKEYKPIIIFWVILILFILIWSEHVEKTNEKQTNQKNNYKEMELIKW